MEQTPRSLGQRAGEWEVASAQKIESQRHPSTVPRAEKRTPPSLQLATLLDLIGER